MYLLQDMDRKLNNIEDFMNMVRKEIYTYFQAHDPQAKAEIESAFLDLADYITLILKPVEDALSVMDKTLEDFIAYCKTLGSSIKNFNPRDWIYNSCWNKTVEKSFSKYEKDLVAYTRTRLRHPHMAPDVVQDAFRKLHTLKPGEIRKDIEHWLYTTCRNRAYDLNRKNSRSVSLDDVITDPLTNAGDKPDNIAILNEDYRYLIDFLESSLNQTQLQLLKLKFEKQMSSREIAATLNLSENYVRKALCITLMSVRKQLHEKE